MTWLGNAVRNAFFLLCIWYVGTSHGWAQARPEADAAKHFTAERQINAAPTTRPPLVLGYTIIRDTEGTRLLTKTTQRDIRPTTGKSATPAPVERVNEPQPVFRLGDRVRLLLEANAAGFLYVFNTVNGTAPEMIFPSARLRGGANDVQAHVPLELPSRDDPDPSLHWFDFQPPAGTEELYLVLSRNPLPGLPSGNALLQQCQQKSLCKIEPPAAVWQEVVKAARPPLAATGAKAAPIAVTEAENDAIKRRIRLPADAAPPSVLAQSQRSDAERLVIIVKLVSVP